VEVYVAKGSSRTTGESRGEEAAGAAVRRARRLGLDLHDGPLQTASLLEGELKALEAELAPVSEAPKAVAIVRDRVGDLRAILAQLQRELREIVLASGSATSSIDLYAALDDVVQGFRRRSPAELVVDLDDGLDDLTDSQQLAVFHIAQEAMSNAAVHSGASSVTLSIRRELKGVVIAIDDDGNGFDSSVERIGHAGLTSMRERAEMLGGEFSLHTRPGGPTRLHAVLPSWDRNATSGLPTP
jgi:signal transduction histidine kinase